MRFSGRTDVFSSTIAISALLPLLECAFYAKGPADPIIQVKSGKGAGHGAVFAAEPLVLWCQAFDSVSGRPVAAHNASFKHNGKLTTANLTKDGYNASLVVEPAPVDTLAGNWTCELHTQREIVTGVLTAYVRGVVLANSSIRFDQKDPNKFHYDASGITVTRGEDARLECPVYALAKRLTITWRRNGAYVSTQTPRIRVEGPQGRVLLIQNTTYEDDGIYACTALSLIPVNLQREDEFELIIERRLRIKSELAWLLPLVLIIVCVTLLAIIIVFCEFRKRRNERKLLVEVDEE